MTKQIMAAILVLGLSGGAYAQADLAKYGFTPGQIDASAETAPIVPVAERGELVNIKINYLTDVCDREVQSVIEDFFSEGVSVMVVQPGALSLPSNPIVNPCYGKSTIVAANTLIQLPGTDWKTVKRGSINFLELPSLMKSLKPNEAIAMYREYGWKVNYSIKTSPWVSPYAATILKLRKDLADRGVEAKFHETGADEHMRAHLIVEFKDLKDLEAAKSLFTRVSGFEWGYDNAVVIFALAKNKN